MVKLKPSRVVHLRIPEVSRFVMASGAALEVRRQGTGGFSAVWHEVPQRREAWEVAILLIMYDLRQPGDYMLA